MSIAPHPPFKHMKTMDIPTGTGDTYSFRDEFLGQPTTTHTHGARGNEFDGGFCLGNSSYAAAKVGDKHEMRDWTLGNTTFGEFNQQEKLFGATYSVLPPAPLGTLQAFEIKTEWLLRQYLPDTGGAGVPSWTWGLGWDYLAPNGTVSTFHTFTLQLDFSYSSTLLRTRAGWALSGNKYRGVNVYQHTPAVMAASSSPPDVRLQVILRTLPWDATPGSYAIYQDYWVSVDEGFTWLNCGQAALDNGTLPTNTSRLHQLYIGSGWDEGINSTVWKTTRNWDAFTYLWNVRGGFVFAYTGRSHSQMHARMAAS